MHGGCRQEMSVSFELVQDGSECASRIWSSAVNSLKLGGLRAWPCLVP